MYNAYADSITAAAERLWEIAAEHPEIMQEHVAEDELRKIDDDIWMILHMLEDEIEG